MDIKHFKEFDVHSPDHMANFAMMIPTKPFTVDGKKVKMSKRFFGFCIVKLNVKRRFGWIPSTPVNPSRKAFSFILFAIVYDPIRKYSWTQKDGITYWSEENARFVLRKKKK